MSDKVSSLPILGTEAEQAAAWVARLDRGDLADDEAKALQEWLDARPGRRETLDRYSTLWALGAVAVSRHVRDLDRRGSPLNPSQRFSFGRRTIVFASAAVTAASGVLLIKIGPAWFTPSEGGTPGASEGATQLDLQTADGQRSFSRLPDGSQLHAAATTRVKYFETVQSRHIVLDQGEVVINAQPQPERGLVVSAGAARIRVVGTTFSVRRTSGDIVQVTVAKGQVRVALTSASGSILLGPGDRSIARNRTIELERPGIERILRDLSWTEGRLSFEDQPLGDVAADLQRHAGIGIQVDDRIAALRVSGSVSLDSPQAFLSGLEVGSGLKVRREAGVFVISP